jgi:hypothetical protein
MKYDLEYDWIFGDQPDISKQVIKWLFEGEDYKGVGGKYDSFEDDFKNLVDVLEDEAEMAENEKTAAQAERALQRGKEADHVLISQTVGELWVSFSKFKEVKPIKPGQPTKVGTSLLKVKINKEPPGSPAPLSLGIST